MLYTVGAGVCVARKPNLVPGVFGFQELFDAFTLGASAAHFAAVAARVREARKSGTKCSGCGSGDKPSESRSEVLEGALR